MLPTTEPGACAPQSPAWRAFVLAHALAVVLDTTEKWQHPAPTAALLALAGWLLVASPAVRRWLEPAWFAASLASLLPLAPDLANHRNLTIYLDLVVLAAWAATCVRARRWRAPDDALFATLAPVLRASAAAVYFFAGFHKLNHDFLFEPQVSCAGWFADKLSSIYLGAPLPLPAGLVVALAALTIAWELGLALALPATARHPRARLVALCAAWLLHGVLALSVFFDFGALMFALLLAFVPAELLRRDPTLTRRMQLGLALTLAGGLCSGLVFAAWPARPFVAHVLQGVLFDAVVLALVVPLVALGWRRPARPRADQDGANPTAAAAAAVAVRPPGLLWLAPVALVLFASSNYLGLRTAGTFSMFSNLRTEGGVSNHLLVPADHPLVLGELQRDLVHLEALDPRVEPRLRDELEGMAVPRVELDRHLARWRADGLGPVRAVVVDARGRRHRVADLGRVPGLERPRHPWAMWGLDFRPVQPDPRAPNACRW